MSNFFEYEGFTGLEYTPFDDAREEDRYYSTAISAQTGSAMDTSTSDNWRQGVELTIAKYLYGSTLPKIWAGNLKHQIPLITYGQAVSWVEHTRKLYHDDELSEFDPFVFIVDSQHFHTPVYFNGGPQQEDEAILEPLSIPFRKDFIINPHPQRTVRGNLEDGNELISDLGNTEVKQFVEYSAPLTLKYFLDSGQEYYCGPMKTPGVAPGLTTPQNAEKAIIIDGYTPINIRKRPPFNDTNDEEIVKQLTITELTTDDTSFLGELKKLSIELDEDLRETYIQRSATAGTTVYGPLQARTGTDSFAFANLMRGS